VTFEEDQSEYLFSYGTLRTETVQLALFGRRLEGKPDVLAGYQLTTIEVQDQSFVAHSGAVQRSLQYTGNPNDLVEGSVFSVMTKELERSDAYEPAEYRRLQVRLKSGVDAWVYISSQY
jgi:gamma-glutamylcyclotransferase (GGCT)/AIG2-like uncharacterized protein YtfP